jgi:hypothetical protein
MTPGPDTAPPNCPLKAEAPTIRFGSQAEAASSRLSEVPHTSVCGQYLAVISEAELSPIGSLLFLSGPDHEFPHPRFKSPV